MALFKEIYDPIRRAQVAKTPEEEVRQSLIKVLIEELGYPKELIAVEVDLKSLPHLQEFRGRLPSRRADLLVYIRQNKGLIPLLLVECKADKLNDRAKRQIIGYNTYIKAPYLALASRHQVLFGYASEGEYLFIEGLPTFERLAYSG